MISNYFRFSLCRDYFPASLGSAVQISPAKPRSFSDFIRRFEL